MLRLPKMSHSFTQNRCWTTLQAPRHEGWKTCVKNGRQNQIFEAPETVWWLGPTDPDPPWFYDRSTLLHKCIIILFLTVSGFNLRVVDSYYSSVMPWLHHDIIATLTLSVVYAAGLWPMRASRQCGRALSHITFCVVPVKMRNISDKFCCLFIIYAWHWRWYTYLNLIMHWYW